MKKILLIISISIGFFSPIFCAELCQEFDAEANIITVDCVTRQRIVTKAELDKENKLQEEKAKAQKVVEEKKKEKVQKEKSKPEVKQNKALEGESVQVNGETFYLSKNPYKKQQEPVGIRAKDWMISIAGGGGGYLDGMIKSDFGNYNMKNSTLISVSVSFMRFINSYFGLGLGVESDQNVRESYSFYFSNGVVKSQLKVHKLMLLGRINLNPAHAARLYLPLGIGYSSIKEKQNVQILSPYSSYDNSFSKSSVIYFAGIGLEVDLTKSVSLGIEGRYNRFTYYSEPFSYLNGLMKINVKF